MLFSKGRRISPRSLPLLRNPGAALAMLVLLAPLPGAAQTYCAASGGACNEYISRVQFNTIDNSSGCNGYADYTTLTTVVERSSAYGITVNNGSGWSGDACDAWVDWNQDADFGDAGEATTLSGGPSVFTGSISVPAGASQRVTRLRIRLRYYESVNPCGTFTPGEVEDYTVFVKSDQTIAFPALAPQKPGASVGLAATASSGLPVSFAVDSGPGSIAAGTNLTVTGVGDVAVVASQAGNTNYYAAANVTNIVKGFGLGPEIGPFAGGNTVVITNGGFGAITNVLLGGAAAAIQDSGATWVRITAPATGSAGVKDVVIQTAAGDVALAKAYTVNPPGVIRGRWWDATQWQEVSGLPMALHSLGAGALKDRLYAVSGTEDGMSALTNVYQFDGSNWTAAAGLPSGRMNMMCATFQDALFAMAGDGIMNTAFTNAYRFDGSNWTEVPGLPVVADLDPTRRARIGPAGGVLNDALCVFGGFIVGHGLQTNAFRFDGTNWPEIAGLPAGRFRMGGGAYGGAVYAAGGSDMSVVHSNLYRYDGTNWVEAPALPVAVARMAVGALEDGLYVAGGADQTSAGISNAYRFNGTNWAEIPGLPAPRTYMGSAVLDGSLYVVGGYTNLGNGPVTNVYRYPGWIPIPALSPTSGPCAGGYPVTITGINLGDGGDVTNVTLCGVRVLSITSQSATQIVVVAGAAVPGPGYARVYSASFGESAQSNAFSYQEGLLVLGTNGEVIADGEAPSAAKGTQFRPGAAWTNVFAITNGGSGAVALTSVTTNGTDPDAFRVIACPAAVEAGTASNLVIAYGETAMGWQTARIDLSHDSAGSPYELNVKAQGEPDMMTVWMPTQSVAGVERSVFSRRAYTVQELLDDLLAVLDGTNLDTVIAHFGGLVGFNPAFTAGDTNGWRADLDYLFNQFPEAANVFIMTNRVGEKTYLDSYGNYFTTTEPDQYDPLPTKQTNVLTLYAGRGTAATGILASLNNLEIVARTNLTRFLVYDDTPAIVNASAGPHGTIVPAGAVEVRLGSSTSFVVTADTYYWVDALLTNGVTNAAAVHARIYTSWWNNVLANGTVSVSFAEALAALGTPEWWLAQYGLTNGGASFDEAETNDTDGDHVAASGEYLADTIPTNGKSYLHLTAIQSNLLEWVGGTGAVQFLEWSSTVSSEDWTTLMTNPTPTPLTNTWPVSRGCTNSFFRLRSIR